MNPVELSLNEFLVYILVLLRMSGLVVFAPFFGGENFPRVARIGLAAFLALTAYHRAEVTLGGMPLPLSLIDLGFLALREVLVGAAFGYGASLIFSAAQLAGELVGQQMGISLANVVDPVMDQEVGIISFFQFTLAIAVFLALDLHLVVLKLLGMSYSLVGLGRATIRPELVEQLGEMFGDIWTGAVQLGAPMLLVMLLVSVVVGFLVRTMPQLNIIVVGLPSRVFVGLLVLSFVMRPFTYTLASLLDEMLYDLQLLLQWVGPPQTAGA